MVEKKGLRYIGYTAVMPAHMQKEGKDGGTRSRGGCGKESKIAKQRWGIW